VTEEQKYEREWHLDKKVPIAMIVTITLQTVGVIWFAAGLFHRVESLERESMARGTQADRITRLEVRLETVQDGILEIKRILQSK
jgi:hypothetical protein